MPVIMETPPPSEDRPVLEHRSPSLMSVAPSSAKPPRSTPQLLARVANSMLFELNKSQLKARMKLGLLQRGTPSPRTPLLTIEDGEEGMRETPRDGGGSDGGQASLASSRRSSRATLKAVDLHDYLSSVLITSPPSPSLHIKHSGHSSSTPNLRSLLAASAAISTAARLAKGVAALPMPMTKLPERAILGILKASEGEDVYRMAMTCTMIRRIAIDNAKGLRHRRVRSREIQVFVDRNRADRMIFSILRVPRSMRDGIPRECGNLEELLPQLVTVEAKMTFGSDVSVGALRGDLCKLRDTRRIAPTAFHFTGGANTKGNKLCGADLRQFTVESFICFCAYFQPELREVQLATTRHFRLTPRLLSIVSVVDDFGCVYERPALRVQLVHLSQIIKTWRSDALAHSCTVRVRRPLADGDEIERALEGVEVMREERGGEEMVSSLTVHHGALPKVELRFIFH